MEEATKPCPFCGEQILAVAIKCKHCGSDLRTGPGQAPAQVPATPTATRKKSIGAGGIAATLVAVIILIAWVGGSSGNHSTAHSSDQASSQSAAAPEQMPQAEVQFIQAVADAQAASSGAENDMQRGGIKAARDKTICSVLPTLDVTDWIGTIDKIDSNSDGKGVIVVSLAHGIKVATWNNAISDISDNTLIEPGTELFNTASALKTGKRVAFSGSFIKGVESECIGEQSLTLRGKIEDPQFTFRFASIGTSIPKATSAVAAPPNTDTVAQGSTNPDASACVDVARQGLIAGNIENVCGFNNGLKDALKERYSQAGCASKLKRNDIDKVSEEVLTSAANEYAQMGIESWCQDSKQWYDEQSKSVGLKTNEGATTTDVSNTSSLKPSFDCAKALSVSEKLICSDAELSKLDVELAEIYKHAKAVAPNPGDFQQENRAAWMQRETTCRDKACLVEWYARRRAALLTVANGN